MDLNNKVIEVLNIEHGQQVKKFFCDNKIDTSNFLFNGINSYYGVISGHFYCCKIEYILNSDVIEIIKLPPEYWDYENNCIPKKHIFKPGDGCICSDEEQLKLLRLAKENGYNILEPSSMIGFNGIFYDPSSFLFKRGGGGVIVHNYTVQELKQLLTNKPIKPNNMQTISKKDLEEIYNVACNDWKKKIMKKATEFPFCDFVEYSEEEVEEMFNAATDSQRPVLEKFFKMTKADANKIYVLKYGDLLYKAHRISDDKWAFISLSNSNTWANGEFDSLNKLFNSAMNKSSNNAIESFSMNVFTFNNIKEFSEWLKDNI